MFKIDYSFARMTQEKVMSLKNYGQRQKILLTTSMDSTAIYVLYAAAMMGIEFNAVISFDKNDIGKNIEELRIGVSGVDSLSNASADSVLFLTSALDDEGIKHDLANMGFTVISQGNVNEIVSKLSSQYKLSEDVLTIEQIHKILLKQLKFIDDICRENNLRYFLEGGTLLGAIRHNGFIPWDDDVDISMPIKDMKKLGEIWNDKAKELNSDFTSFYTTEGYNKLFAQITDNTTFSIRTLGMMFTTLGVTSDIFPIIGLPDDDDECDKFIQKVNLELAKHANEAAFNISDSKTSNLDIVCKLMEKYDYDEVQKNVGFYCLGKNAVLKYPKSVFGKVVRKKFENIELNVAYRYDFQLETIYNYKGSGSDWRRLPPKDQRVCKESPYNYIL